MTRLLFASSLALLILIAAGTGRSDDADKLTGTWVYKVQGGDTDQYWSVARPNGTWVVTGWYLKGGVEIGSFVGTDVAYADGSLTYIHKYVKKPGENLTDNTPAKITPSADGLAYRWGKDYSKGPRTLARSDVKRPGAKVALDPKKEGRFVGTWKGTGDGPDQHWTITFDDGTWSVKVQYLKGGVEIGSFVGSEVKYSADGLAFKRKFVKKPSSELIDDSAMTLKTDGANLLYSFAAAGSRSRVLEPVKGEPAVVAKEPDTARFAGSWEGEVDPFRTHWTIRRKDGKWDVYVEYFTRNAKTGVLTSVGSFVGTNVDVKAGNLVFETSFIKKPTPTWSGGKLTCKLLDDNRFEYVRETDGVKAKALPVTRMKK